LSEAELNDLIIENFKEWRARETIDRFLNSAVYLCYKRCRENRIVAVPFFRNAEAFSGYWLDGSENHVELDITNIPIIDTSKLTWEHIIELRQDRAFQEKLRRFRLIFASEYGGKDPSFVTDSLYQRISDYETSCKQHGVGLVVGTLKQMVSSKSSLSAAGLVILGALAKDPAINSWSVVAGAALEFAGLTLYAIEKRIEFSRSLGENGIAYLVDLKKRGLVK